MPVQTPVLIASTVPVYSSTGVVLCPLLKSDWDIVEEKFHKNERNPLKWRIFVSQSKNRKGTYKEKLKIKHSSSDEIVYNFV